MEIGPGTWYQREYCKQHGTRVQAPYQPADLLFWLNEGPVTPSHVGIATGQDTIIEETASYINAISYNNIVEVPLTPRWSQPFVEGWRIPLSD